MVKYPKIIAIIPARGGSKGLPGKNIKILNGKPLIVHTIEAALKSKIFAEVVVSTDCLKIAEISKSAGANVPFLRPDNLSSDTATSIDVVLHCLKFFEQKQEFDLIMLLQPTSPLRNENDILESYQLFLKTPNASSIISVCESEHPNNWYQQLPENLSMINFVNAIQQNVRRQDLQKTYRMNGAIYLCTSQIITEEKKFMNQHSYGYVMSVQKSVDIDNIFDFILAEAISGFVDKN